MILTVLTFLAAICLSGVAAWYSILGLMSIFSSSAASIGVMGVVLEAAKLVSASWLYHNWRTAPAVLKSYLCFAIVVLMAITSMGIYGFLSKAHVGQSSGASESVAAIGRLDERISSKKADIERIRKEVSQIDSALDKYIELGAVTKGLASRELLSSEKESLWKKADKLEAEVQSLLDERSILSSKVRDFEVEVGPVRYMAELVYDDVDQEVLEKSVQYLSLVIVSVFDPLAVLLLVAANSGLRRKIQGELLVSSIEGERVVTEKKSIVGKGT